MRVLVTGAQGFVGKNLALALSETNDLVPIALTRSSSEAEWSSAIAAADVVVHLAGANRPPDPTGFIADNVDLTQKLCARLLALQRPIPIAFASSIRAGEPTPYGRSKFDAETYIRQYASTTGARIGILRLPNVFGKWCRPNYNSAVATFCHRIAGGQQVEIHDRAAMLKLVYIDDVVATLKDFIRGATPSDDFLTVRPEYETTVGELADHIGAFRRDRENITVDAVGTGFLRALHATYLSYLKGDQFTVPLTRHVDSRGYFMEVLKTKASGQFSVFSAGPGITRGGHYHHTKSEKFLIVQGSALFRFKHIDTGELLEITVVASDPRTVETVPGWAHDVTNIGDNELIGVIWANEIFDRDCPDTIQHSVRP